MPSTGFSAPVCRYLLPRRRTTTTRLAAIVPLLATLMTAGCGAQRQDKETFTGRELVIAGKYAEAVPTLEDYLRQQPRGKSASRAGLFLGKAYLGLGEFDKSRQAFEMTIEQYPRTLEAHKSRYKLALLALLGDEKEKALRLFREMADQPDGPLAPEAKAMADFLAREERD